MERNDDVSPLHESVDNQPPGLVNILPAIQALSGSDTTSKIGTKNKAFKVAKNEKHQTALQHFGIGELDSFMLDAAEAFLIDCISTRKSNLAGSNSFNNLRHLIYHDSKKFELANLPCTTNTLCLHIMRAYLQTRRWVTSATLESPSIRPENYGYHFEDKIGLIPIILDENRELLPEDFPKPCNCLKCTRKTVCPCRVGTILCCEFCNCRIICKNNKPS